MAKMGRPLKFKSPQEILDIADKYFKKCLKNKQPITVTGLCMALDTTREILMDYQDERGPAFSNAVKKCKTVCENYAENQLYKKHAAAGPIFALKNFGWKDTQKIDHTAEISIPEIDAKIDALLTRLEGK